MITCAFCGREFEEEEGRQGCGGCGGACHAVHCPACGYKNPRESGLIRKIREIVRNKGDR